MHHQDLLVMPEGILSSGIRHNYYMQIWLYFPKWLFFTSCPAQCLIQGYEKAKTSLLVILRSFQSIGMLLGHFDLISIIATGEIISHC